MRKILFVTVLLSMMGCNDASEMRACGEMCGAVGVKEFYHHDTIFLPEHGCTCNQPSPPAVADGGIR